MDHNSPFSLGNSLAEATIHSSSANTTSNVHARDVKKRKEPVAQQEHSSGEGEDSTEEVNCSEGEEPPRKEKKKRMVVARDGRLTTTSMSSSTRRPTGQREYKSMWSNGTVRDMLLGMPTGNSDAFVAQEYISKHTGDVVCKQFVVLGA